MSEINSQLTHSPASALPQNGSFDVTYKFFDDSLGVLGVQVNIYDERIVDFLRTLRTRTYQTASKMNLIGTGEIDKLHDWLIHNGFTVTWADGVEEKYEAFKVRPDFYFEFDRRGNKVICRRRGRDVAYPWNPLSTWTHVLGDDSYSFSPAELYKLPEVFAYHTVGYSDEVKTLLTEQIEKRAKLMALSTAEDAEVDNLPPQFEKFYPFQRVAIKFAEAIGNRAILAYDMGLGKTPMSIAAAERIIASDLRAKILIVCPATLKINWYREIEKWTGRQAVMLSGTSPDEISINSIIVEPHNYYIINYDIIGRAKKAEDGEIMPWPMTLNFANFALTIYDEGHYMKNVDSQRSKGGRAIKSKHTLALTGTPIVNRPDEIWPLLNIVDPDTFKSRDTFISQYLSSDGKSVRNQKALQDILLSYMIRRRKEDVIKDLPTISRIDHMYELSDLARAAYTKVLEGIYISLKNPDYQREVNSILAEIMRLKQICALDAVQHTVELAENIINDTGKKVLIFSQFLESCRDIHTKIPGSLIITGEDTGSRYSRIDQFQSDPDIPAMVLSTKAGAEGLTLTAAEYVIFNDLMWTPKDHLQAEARCYGRMNDMHGAVAYYVQAEKTIMQWIQEMLRSKLAIIESTVDNLNSSAAANESVFNELLNKLRNG